MTLSANLQEGTWSVSVRTNEARGGGYQSTIFVKHSSPGGDFEHGFHHATIFASEREAVLEGLREGMTWIALKTNRTIAV
ncbi:hypothetical protein LJ656_07090 [Paraburkholderia sp. MMS20-SJTR3]|uniref:UDP-glucose 4-epimerase n=1 Tax=Paraburkholderia sejongensis TaxID=2886946 RepID=A0ABS8JRH6_9BURK|nr:hypothetical protein [Paraburkholderia sp. MMS20-SJTR3]MCC8392349.1 hypothetical protein [Paraburkholderia sp. MMS20-SJTR3]